MNQSEVRRSVERLRAYSQTLGARAPEAREHVNSLVTELDAYLTLNNPQPDALMRALADSVRRFEAEHPALTSAMQQVIAALSSAGI